MEADEAYSEYLDRLADTHSDRLSAVFDTLEERIAEALDSAPVKAGKLFDLEYAVNARTEIKDILEDVYSREVNSILKDYKAVAGKTLGMLNEYGDFTQVDPAIIRNLQKLSFRGFEDIASSHLDIMATEVYQNTLTGRTRAEMVKSVRQSINGVYIKSNEAEINALVAVAKNGTAAQSAAAVDKLHRVYSADRVGNNMRRYSTQMVQDSLMQFDASINTAIGVEAGIDTWKYYGDLIKDSRQFCKTHAGKVYTTAEIEEIWQGSWAGKSSSDGLIARGGYNCRHHFRPYLLESEGEEVTPKAKGTQKDASPEVKVVKAAESVRLIDKVLRQGNENDRYPQILSGGKGIRYNHKGSKKRNETDAQFFKRSGGKVNIKGSDELMANTNEILTELAETARKYNIPEIRSVVTIRASSSSAANMGDGMLGINVDYAENVMNAKYLTESQIKDKIKELKNKKNANAALLFDSDDKYDRGEIDRKTRIKMEDKIENQQKKLQNQISGYQSSLWMKTKKTEKWTLTDDIKDRPNLFQSQISDPIESYKAVLEHEFGHQLHQQWGVNGQYLLSSKPPIEKWLKTIPKKDRIYASTYASSDEFEWFAEAFSAFSQGRKDLVDPQLLELFEALGDDDKVAKIIGFDL